MVKKSRLRALREVKIPRRNRPPCPLHASLPFGGVPAACFDMPFASLRPTCHNRNMETPVAAALNTPIFEALMMACFSVSWVFAIIRSARSRLTGGKSIIFLWIIFIGYFSGIIHKIFVKPDWVVWLYSLNGFMVAVDMVLYYRNLREERLKRC